MLITTGELFSNLFAVKFHQIVCFWVKFHPCQLTGWLLFLMIQDCFKYLD
ncbi:hypothetical protein SLEP1_g49171 [Rubroshorea leprosula]|uniref:Uncharacterized protein n=1 Tax=Rubroshorea leprosula TaxID=152421 RepID=A0AAV5LW95_9ROSI|nr:hypothetical protein SLEP1_g49171 [Rubroshorea leprosula]